MTKEELEQEAEKKCVLNDQIHRDCYVNGYITGAVSREKKIVKLEKDCKYFSDNLDLQIEATLKLQNENTELKEKQKTAYIKGIRHFAKALKEYDRINGSWTDYFEHTVDEVLKRELNEVEKC